MPYTIPLDYEIGSNTVRELLIFLGYFLGFYIGFKIFRKVIVKKLKNIVSKTETKLDDELVKIFENIHPRFYDLLALYCSSKTLNFTANTHKYLDLAFGILLIIQLSISTQEFLRYILQKVLKIDPNHNEAKTAFNGIYLLIRILLWSSSFLMILSLCNVNVSSLITSLGIGGIAIALAVQNILGDVFSSFSIYFDKPFVIGDYIEVGNDAGTVRKIGLKSTRLESPRGEELIISNRELTSSRIQNFKNMQKRQVQFKLRIKSKTTNESLKAIPKLITEIINSKTKCVFERARLKDLAISHLEYDIVYYHLSADLNDCLETREQINLELLEKLGSEIYFGETPLASH